MSFTKIVEKAEQLRHLFSNRQQNLIDTDLSYGEIKCKFMNFCNLILELERTQNLRHSQTRG